MSDRIEILKDVFVKSNKLHFVLFLFIVIYISIKWTSFSIESNDLNVLRSEQRNLNKIILPLKNFNSYYINLCNIDISEKEKITQLKSFFEYINNESLVSKENEKDIDNIIKFLRFVIHNILKNGVVESNIEKNTTILELLTFSENLKYFENYTNNITLIKEIPKSVDKYKNFTTSQKSKIIGGEDIFIGITSNFGNKVQKINNIEDECKDKIFIQAKKLFYSYDDFTNLSIGQLDNLNKKYNEYTAGLLENKMTKRNMIPIINIVIDKIFFSQVILLLIILFSVLLLVETIRLKKINIDKNLFYNTHSFMLFLFFPKDLKKEFSFIEKLILFPWSLLNIAVPLLLIGFIIGSSISIFEVAMVILFSILFYFWIYLIFTLFPKMSNT